MIFVIVIDCLHGQVLIMQEESRNIKESPIEGERGREREGGSLTEYLISIIFRSKYPVSRYSQLQKLTSFLFDTPFYLV